MHAGNIHEVCPDTQRKSAFQIVFLKATLLKDTELHPRRISLDSRTKDVGTQSEID